MFALPITFVFFLFINLITTVFMTGVCYFVQFIHYPLFRVIKEDNMPRYAEANQSLSSFLIFPVMILEAVTSLWLAFDPVFPNLDMHFNLGVALVIIIWLSTFLLQMPTHRKLLDKYSDKTISFLISTNWIRTIAWSSRTLLMSYLIYRISHQCFPK